MLVMSLILTVLAVVSYVSPGLIANYGIAVLPIPGGVAAAGFVASLAALFTARTHKTGGGQAYSELASELSQVAGKSEVVINAINDGVIALDGQGVVQLINPAAQQLLGWIKQDSVGLSYKSIFKMIDTKNQPVAEANDPVEQVRSRNEVVKTDTYSLQTHSGKSFMAYISVSPVGQLGSGVIIVFRDITTEKSDERQRAEFISTASHEMRTPVASIEGYLGLALNPATATIDDKARDFINKAHASAQHLGNLFADLLDVSKADDGRLKSDPAVIDIVPFLHTIVEGLTHKATEKGLRILYKPMPDGERDEGRKLNPVFYVNVDNDHLREVSENLIENAIKYTPKGDVIVDITGNNEKVVLSVTDTGIGIPREDQSHLFQKFYRVDNSDTREIGGTGLGLYLCRRLAESMGGRIWVESEYKKGSTFFVELPRIGHEEATRLIEQASIEAEKQAAAEQAQAERDAQQTQDESLVQLTEMTLPPIPPAVEPQPLPAAPSVPPAPATPAPAVPLASPLAPPAPIIPVTPDVSVPVAPAAPIALAPAALPDPATVAIAPSIATPAPQPVPAPVPLATPAMPQPLGPSPVNTPLSAIEANPSQYTRATQPTVTIPPRQ